MHLQDADYSKHQAEVQKHLAEIMAENSGQRTVETIQTRAGRCNNPGNKSKQARQNQSQYTNRVKPQNANTEKKA